jgi:hypothetical protein
MSYTQEEKDLLERFQNTFKVRANSMASQTVEISREGTGSYEDTYVYGDTLELDIIHEDEVVKVIKNPSDDANAILTFAKEWKEKEYPTPEDNSTLFDTQE